MLTVDGITLDLPLILKDGLKSKQCPGMNLNGSMQGHWSGPGGKDVQNGPGKGGVGKDG